MNPHSTVQSDEGANQAPFVVRALQPSDSIAELTSLLHLAYSRLAQMGLNFTATDQSEAVTAKRCSGGHCLVAVAGDKLIGTVTLLGAGPGVPPPEIARPGLAHFEQFAVDPDWQGCGVGRRLLKLAEMMASDAGASVIACDTAEPAEHLVRMYQAWGYQTEYTMQWPGKTYRSLVMVKRLDSVRM